ncbi:MAG: tRNA (adenosine(37)-N6)-dimethylallyltransferase MiaA [Nitrosomonas sp.]|nr:tRNA (adenosine(37)-N6)-dimethylallyltransferase MiaA [Nitrosomonas sp.]
MLTHPPSLELLPPAIVILGPTASGKSNLALSISDHFPVEIISIDSAQVYRYMDIGSAKPDPHILTKIPHHLINLIDPDQQYSAAQFRNDALHTMKEITLRGNIPLLVGGTMLYFKALREGLSDLPPANQQIRKEIEASAAEKGWSAQHHLLQSVDPTSAERIQSNDSQRIQRALEIYYLTGKPMSALMLPSKPVFIPYQLISIALLPADRTVLHQRIQQLFEMMLTMGLIEEVQSILSKFPLTLEMPSMRCVGYRQVYQYLHNQLSLIELREKGVAATRQLAKRQLTWLRSMTQLTAFDCLADNLPEQVLYYLQITLNIND